MIIHIAGYIGRGIDHSIQSLQNAARFFLQSVYWATLAPVEGKGLRFHETVKQMVRTGFEALPLIVSILFLIGLIMTMQAAYQLKKFGATMFVADLNAVAITRELGPLLTAIIIAARSGSSFAAEIGTMKVSEEIDALETMALNPLKFLVVPKMLGLVIVLPFVTLIADVMGIFGGFVLGVNALGIDAGQYITRTADALVMKDILTGLMKSGVFALLIAQVGCFQGFAVRGGAEGVGLSTTRSVVTAIFAIILADVIFTTIFYIFL